MMLQNVPPWPFLKHNKIKKPDYLKITELVVSLVADIRELCAQR